jgi:hypothetical protein
MEIRSAGPCPHRFQIEIDRHGLTHASLQCDVADQGSATVGAALIDALIALGTSGFPKITAARRTADATTLANGCVELQVLNAVRTNSDCPMGKSWAPDIQTCR